MRRTNFTVVAAALVASVAMSSCGDDPQVQQPRSLQAPASMEVVDGQVCLPEIFREDATFGLGALPSCDDGGNGFGLVTNQRSGHVGVVALGQELPRMVNLDNREPGITPIRIDGKTVDVTATGDATAAVAADQSGSRMVGIDLWTLQPLEETLPVSGTLNGIETLQGEDNQWVVGAITTEPNRLELRHGLVCDRPDVSDRRNHDPSENCQWEDVDTDHIDLPGRPVDLTVDSATNQAWVIYRDRNELSWIAFDDEGMGDGDECLDGGAAPCEIDRVQWEQPGDTDDWGATGVDADPLGQFVYVVDRPTSRLLVFDLQRRSLINASEAIEPSMLPTETRPGIPLRLAPTALSADLDRQIIDDGHVLYQFGARIAADNGEVYRAGVADVECVFDDDEPLSNEEFFFDEEARTSSDEAGCLEHLPALPLYGNPDFDDDDELLERRVVEAEDGDVSVAVTPVFALRDADGRDSEIFRTRCNQPMDFRELLADAESGEGTGCGSPLSPQPVGVDVEDDLDDYDDEPRADLMVFAHTYFEAGEPQINRSVFDLRVLGEEWSITYEGVLPQPGRSGAGLVARDDEGTFTSGGVDYCSAGVETRDLLTIITEPGHRDGCDVFDSDDPEHRTWEITDVGPFEVGLAVLEDDERYVDELPTRRCFPQGLDYQIRAGEAWTVIGDQSGLTSSRERDGNRCVLRPGADSERSRLGGRVDTGERFVGPYFQFQLREGEVEPMRDLEYTFETRRRFMLDAQTHVPETQEPTLPSQVLFTPDLGAGRLMGVVDSGGDRIYLHNFDEGREHFVR